MAVVGSRVPSSCREASFGCCRWIPALCQIAS
jgi:hypothetical protein